MDRLSISERSALMAKVRSGDTKPELCVRRVAHALGLRFRLHRHDLPGSPDLVFPRHNIVIFVHGCFWHQHPGCKRASIPKSRADFWCKKLARNAERDRIAVSALKAGGWHVVVIWECETRDRNELRQRLTKVFEGRKYAGLADRP
jgi:DNA mismatch endonuclease, patch repair protein